MKKINQQISKFKNHYQSTFDKLQRSSKFSQVFDSAKDHMSTDKCALQDIKITCTIQSPTLDSYVFCPELFRSMILFVRTEK